MYWNQRFRHIKIEVKDESSQDNLTLSHISLAFYIILCCFPFSIAILLIEIFCFFFKLRIVDINDLSKANDQNVHSIIGNFGM